MNENHIFVLQQVINDLLDTDNSLEKALIRLNYFARLIKNDELGYYGLNSASYFGLIVPAITV